MAATQNTPNNPLNNLKRNRNFRSLLVAVVLVIGFNIFLSFYMGEQRVEIEYNQFITLVEKQAVDKVQVDSNQLVLTLKDTVNVDEIKTILNQPIENPQNNVMKEYLDKIFKKSEYYTGTMNDPNLVEFLSENNVAFYRSIDQGGGIFDLILSWVLPLVIFYLFYMFMMRNLQKRIGKSMGDDSGFGGFMNVGKSKAKKYDLEKSTGITFADVAGQEEAKESLNEIVDFLHNPTKYQEIGAKQPKGALLVGPPGTGKTLLAKATAGEAKVAFFSLSGSEFIEMYVGVGASRVRDLFVEANKLAPCIIFIDEIDAIGRSRDNQMGGNSEQEQTLNQLLAEMDGFDSSKGVVVLAATNRPEILDKALLRPGRFDRQIIVERPDLQGRIDILKVHLQEVKKVPDINLKTIALATGGATGADIANIVNEAALRAVRLGRKEVAEEDLMESVEVVIAGKEKKDRVMNAKEREIVSYHEVGHALVAAMQKNSQPVQKITIVPRTMGALGYTMQMPEEERFLLTKEELLVQITTLLGGRSAEEVKFGEVTTGASNDIERATQLARSMVTQYGMTEKFDMMGLESIQNRYLDGRMVPTCSEATGKEIDEEVQKIIKTCHQNAQTILTENIKVLDEISQYLNEKETITGDEFMAILRTYHPEEQEV